MILGDNREMEAHIMRRQFAIAVATLSLFAVMFSEMGIGETVKDAVNAQSKPDEYAVALDPYLPIQGLRPVW